MTTKCNRNLDFTAQRKGFESVEEYVENVMEETSKLMAKKIDSQVVAIGDLNSDAPGSGARKNAGKPQLDLIPVRYWRKVWRIELEMEPELEDILHRLQMWQEDAIMCLDGLFEDYPHLMADTVKVLEFGANKYKAWNWAKGMPWSVPTGCILRHAQYIVHGQEIDEESGLPHMAHIMCNVMMLCYYGTHYPEGDDRPPVRN